MTDSGNSYHNVTGNIVGGAFVNTGELRTGDITAPGDGVSTADLRSQLADLRALLVELRAQVATSDQSPAEVRPAVQSIDELTEASVPTTNKRTLLDLFAKAKALVGPLKVGTELVQQVGELVSAVHGTG